MSSLTSIENNEKFPANIQKLFFSPLPVPYFKPLDYPPEQRKTRDITPITEFDQKIKEYVQELGKPEYKYEALPKTKLQIDKERAREKRRRKKESFERQNKQWSSVDPDTLKDWKDPYKTVFISRLDYSLTEVDISKHFNTYGDIESIKIIRDKQNKSRGYGFIVFAKESDASNCIKQLAQSGLKIPVKNSEGNDKTPIRTVLVDMERSRLMSNWKPRRLGGGLGRRGYMATGANASAAASGRRLNLSHSTHYQGSESNSRSYSNYQSSDNHSLPKAFTSHPGFKEVRTNRSARSTRNGDEQKLRDKYSKYNY